MAPGAPMWFGVISFAPGLDDESLARARAIAPPHTGSERPYPELLAESGWALERPTDVTDRFAERVARDRDAHRAREERLVPMIGKSEFDARMATRDARLAAIGAGLLRREIFVARAV